MLLRHWATGRATALVIAENLRYQPSHGTDVFSKRTLGWFFLACLATATFSAKAFEVEPLDAMPDVYGHSTRNMLSEQPYEKIDLFSGKLEQHVIDIDIPGNGGFPLQVERVYRERSEEYINPVGLRWQMHFGQLRAGIRSDVCGSSSFKYPYLDFELPNGQVQRLYQRSTDYASADGWRADCLAPGFSVYSPHGIRYVLGLRSAGPIDAKNTSMPSRWLTTQVIDRNGNGLSISYIKANNSTNDTQDTYLISQLYATGGRQLTFYYSGMNTATYTGYTNADIHLSTIISGDGRSWSYYYTYVAVPKVVCTTIVYNHVDTTCQTVSYTPYYQLTYVALPNANSWTYSYNSPFVLTEFNWDSDNDAALANALRLSYVKNPKGGATSYSYGVLKYQGYGGITYRFPVLTRKSRSGGGVWTFSYTPGANTTVSTPTGTIYAGYYGYPDVAYDECWKVGLPTYFNTSSNGGLVETRNYSWSSSLRGDFASGYIETVPTTNTKCGSYYQARMWQTKIQRDGATYQTNYSNFDYYGNPRAITETGPNGGSRATTLSYYINTTKSILHQVQNESYPGSSITRAFDGDGNLTSITQDGISTSYTYDTQGNIVSATFPRGLVHTYSNYKRGIPQTETQPEAITISRIVSDAGNITSETDGELRTKTFSYDGLNRITSIGYPKGNGVTIAYGTNSKTVTRGDLIESTIYDGFGRPTSVTLGGITRTFSYDALGRKIFESEPGSTAGTSYQYDALNRLTRETNADSTFRSLAYGAGNLTLTDERANATTYTYRSYGDPEQRLLMAMTAPEPSANITLARNTKGLITAVTQGGFTRNYDYNANYYLTSVTNPETGTTTYGRDAAGNMTSRSVGTSGTTNYVYDGQNRLTNATYPGTTPAVTQTYSKTHKLKTVTSTAASRSFVYDANDNLTSESLTVDAIPLTTSYAYNNNDQLSTITYPRSGRGVSYIPDVLGRPTQVSGYVTAVSYWPSGQINQITYNNGTTSSYAQNARLWPSNFITTKGATPYHSSSYTYDGTGNLTTINDAVDSLYNRTLGYDNINRLTTVAGNGVGGNIVYNGVGNITSQLSGTSSLTYGYDAQNRLSSLLIGTATQTFTYDAYGDIATGAGNVYTYDGVPNLRCVNCPTTDKIEYTYDGLNQRVSVTKAGVKAYEVYGSHGNLLTEYTPSEANKLIEYIYLGGKRIAQRQSDDYSITQLVATPNPGWLNRTLTLAATVSGNTPTGTVTFKNDAATLGTATISAGVATLSTSFAELGSYNITASYAGDVNNIASDSPLLVVSVLTPRAPDAPQNVTATGGNRQATVKFAVPVSDGGFAITSYTATSSPDNITQTCTASPCVVTGLANGTNYTFTVTATNDLGTSAASTPSNSVLVATVPGAPTGITATGGNARATVSFTAPVSDGGSAITRYTTTSNHGNKTGTCTTSPCTVTGLTNGLAYTFTVKASNAVGTGTASAASNIVTPATVPDAPTIGTATAGNAEATVAFAAPTSNGGSAITSYTATSSPGNKIGTCTTSPCTVTGLTNGTAYTFTVTATNAVGTGAASPASNSIVPIVLISWGTSQSQSGLHGVGVAGMWFVDINGDGKADYVTKNNDATIHWNLSTGTGWGAPQSQGGLHGVGVAGKWFVDINGDGRADYVTKNNDATIHWNLSTGTGWGAPQSQSGLHGVGGAGMWFVDINGDGKADYVTKNNDATIHWNLSTGTGWAAAQSQGGLHGVGVAGKWFVDINGDGRADYVTKNNDATIHWNLSTGTGWAAAQSQGGLHGAGVAGMWFVDINGDGRADYVTKNNDATIHWNLSTGTGWGAPQSQSGLHGVGGAGKWFVDINGDGKADYVTMDYDGTIHWSLSTGMGWTAPQSQSGLHGVGGAGKWFVDINGDGRADYVTKSNDGALHWNLSVTPFDIGAVMSIILDIIME